MFFNFNEYVKMLAIADSCVSKDHVEITFKMARKFRRTARLTEFEYIEVEQILLNKLKLNIVSRWNQSLDVDKILKMSKIP